MTRRLLNSAVVWSWLFNGLRLASGLLLLPLLFHALSDADLGMYYVFLNLVALLPVLDSSLSLTVSRFVSYAMAGSANLLPQGIRLQASGDRPNQAMLERLLVGTRALYRLMALGVFLLLGVIGTGVVAVRVHETTSPRLAWLAWGITLLAATWETYASWGTVFLQGMNQVVLSSRLSVVTYALRLLLACLLLAFGGGLLSVPLASLVSSSLHRLLGQRFALKLLGTTPHPESAVGMKSFLAVVWPNSWRVGLKLLSMYFSANAIAFLCMSSFGLAAYSQFGLSLQVMTIIHGMSAVWTSVKWPLISQLRSGGEGDRIRELLGPRIWLQSITFTVLATCAWAVGPSLLARWGGGKAMLPSGWLALLAVYTFFEMQFSFWTYLLSTENRIPSLWATIITYTGAVPLVLALIHTTSLGLGGVVLGPLIAGSLFNYWYWPIAGARSLGTSLLRFACSKPQLAPPERVA